MRRNKYNKNMTSLNVKLRFILIRMIVLLIICVIMSFIILLCYGLGYFQITHNLNVSSKFSLDFKKNLDLKMYYYTVGSKEQRTIPVSDIENAISLAESLKKTTHRKESMKTIQNVLNYCDNLKKRMYSIGETKDYRSRKTQLENNIYVLTKLIQDRMMDYIYYEAGYMAMLEEKMYQDIKLVIVIVLVFISSGILLLILRTIQFSKGIVGPISKLCDNINLVGNGVFNIPQVETNDYEIAQLNSGIQQMADRICLLLNSVKEEEKLQHMTELQLLQAQVNPHFLYNTLDTIVWLVESGRCEEAIEMITDLTLFFRTSLSKGNDIIRLDDEILHTRSYLHIQQVRYHDVLDYNITLPKELKEIYIPKLTIQPLAENAIYHGVKEKRGKSMIDISCQEQGEDILIIVSDNGIGIHEDRLKDIKLSLEKGDRLGFGLAAVHERIQLYFGENYGVTINSEYRKGTTVQVKLSKKMNDNRKIIN